jgi:hypothetical protein
MQRYNIGRYKSFTDEATRSPSILENVSITTAILKKALLSLKMSLPWLKKRSTAALERHRRVVPHKKFGQNWPTHESLHKIHLGRACQPVSDHFYGICFVT